MKRHVVEQHLKPGDRLPTEQEWVEMLGVSRLVVREALQMLAGSGLIDVQQGRGAFVRDTVNISVFDQLTFGLDLGQLSYNDVLEARAMLDLTVVELCMLRADPIALDELEGLLDEMDAAIAAGQPHEHLHRAFHYRMLRAAGNPLIERVGAVLMDAFWRIGDSAPNLVHPKKNGAPHGHRELLQAIRERDLEKSREVVAAHLPSQPGMIDIFPLLRLTTASGRRSEIDAHGTYPE
jgi:GntR family transcriptional repressor for pyruvate dehydrogenase complex